MKDQISDMPPLKLKVLLLEAGVTQSEIARKIKVTPQTVNHVVNGRFASHRVRTAIAEAVGKDLKVIWPTIYLYGGGPRKRGRPFSEDTRKRATA